VLARSRAQGLKPDDVAFDGGFEPVDFPKEKDRAAFSAVLTDGGCLELHQRAPPPTALYHVWWSSCETPQRKPPLPDGAPTPRGWSAARYRAYVQTQSSVEFARRRALLAAAEG
jgi:hypothetical protein